MYDPRNERRAVEINIPNFASGVRGYVDNVRQGRYDNDCPHSADVKLVRSTLKLGSRERHALHKFVEDSSGLTSCYSAPDGGNEYRECSAFMGIRGAGVAKHDVAEKNLGTKPRYAGKYKGSLEATGTVRRNARKVLDEVSRHETVVCAAEAYKLFDPPFVWVPVNKNVGER